MKVFVETERFILREIVENDAPDFFELDSDPEVHRYLGNRPVDDIAKCAHVISLIRKQYEDFGIGRWAVIDKNSSAFLGWSGLKYEDHHDVTKEKYFDLGYRIKKKYWGKGVATETALAALDYGFTRMGLNEVCAAAHVENLGSNRVLRKIGMKLSSKFYYEDILCNWYSIERAQWQI